MKHRTIATLTLGFLTVAGLASAQPGEFDTDGDTAGDLAADDPAAAPRDDSTEPTLAAPAVVDFGEEEGFGVGEVMTAEDPEPIEHPPLMREKFRVEVADRVEGHEPASPVSFGLAVGPSYSAARDSTPDPSDRAGATRLGAVASAFLLYRLSPHLSLQPGLQYEMKGAVRDHRGDEVRLHYAALPLMARVEWRAGSLGVHIGVGLALGLALTSSRTDGSDGLEVEPLDLDLVGMAGASLPAGAGRLAVTLVTDYGVTAAATVRDGDRLGEYRGRTLSLTAGYLF